MIAETHSKLHQLVRTGHVGDGANCAHANVNLIQHFNRDSRFDRSRLHACILCDAGGHQGLGMPKRGKQRLSRGIIQGKQRSETACLRRNRKSQTARLQMSLKDGIRLPQKKSGRKRRWRLPWKKLQRSRLAHLPAPISMSTEMPASPQFPEFPLADFTPRQICRRTGTTNSTWAIRGNHRILAAFTPPDIAASCTPCVSFPASRPPRKPISATNICWNTAAADCRWRSISPL